MAGAGSTVTYWRADSTMGGLGRVDWVRVGMSGACACAGSVARMRAGHAVPFDAVGAAGRSLELFDALRSRMRV